jgi:hypothetical protein
VTELRKGKWERALAALLRRARKTYKAALEAPKGAKRKIRIARELQSTSTATNAWIAEGLVVGHPTRVCNMIRARCKYRTDPTTSPPLGQRLIRAQGVRGRILSTGRWTERPMSRSDPAPLRQAQGHAGAAPHLHGGWKGGGGSRCRDAEACSLQRFVRLRRVPRRDSKPSVS